MTWTAMGAVVPDVFISFTRADLRLATFVRNHLVEEGLSVFLAPASISPGERWSSRVLAGLRESDFVILLVSKAASGSAYVNQEFGQALAMKKTVVPIVWDMDPAHLPGWMSEHQALDLRGGVLLERLSSNIRRIAARIRSKRGIEVLVAIAVIGGLVYLAAKARK